MEAVVSKTKAKLLFPWFEFADKWVLRTAEQLNNIIVNETNWLIVHNDTVP